MNLNLINENQTRYSPNTPLIKSPYIKMKLEFRNLDTIIDDLDLLNTFFSVQMDSQVKKSSLIRHTSSPRFNEEIEFQVKNPKDDFVLIKCFWTKLYSTENSCKFLGFQVIPIRILESLNFVGKKMNLKLRLIKKQPEEFFNSDQTHKNFDPMLYQLDEEENPNSFENREEKFPSVVFSFEYFNFHELWKVNVHINSILQKTDTNSNSLKFFYEFLIERNDGLKWSKELTFEEIQEFRNFLIKYMEEIKSVPFPEKSIWRFIPFYMKYYSEDNYDILLERKFYIDNFLEIICDNFKVYKFEEFDRFLGTEIYF